MPSLYERSLIKFGQGLAMTIPKAWADFHGLKPGDKLEVIANGKLTVRPMPKEAEKRGG